LTNLRWYLLGLLALFGTYVALEYYRPKPLDWTPTLSNKDKIPYGTFALYDVLPQLLRTDAVESVRLPVYNQFFDADEPEADEPETDESDEPRVDTTEVAPAATEAPTPDSAVNAPAPSTEAAEPNTTNHTAAVEAPTPSLPRQLTNYLFINNFFNASKPEAQALLAFAAAGNDVFITTSFLGGRDGSSLTDSLGVRLVEADSSLVKPSLRARDSVRVHMLNPALRNIGLSLPADAARTRLAVQAGRAGATLAADQQGRAVLIRLDHGRGHIYLCSVPLAFSNYYVLRPRSRPFALAALSYLPAGRPVWWDEYQKQGRVGEQSVVRVLLAHESLRTAYYLLLATTLLFVLVEARRRQRIIPVLKPLPNTTLLFTRTVAGLYRQGNNHGRIAEKKVGLFLDYLRTRFHEPTPDLSDAAFRERLSQKAGLPPARVDELVRLINLARTAPVVNDQQLLTLSRAIHEFKQEVSRN
jgi:hypothetical protein